MELNLAKLFHFITMKVVTFFYVAYSDCLMDAFIEYLLSTKHHHNINLKLFIPH